MQPLLRWALGATLVASAAAVWWPADTPRIVAALQRPAPAAGDGADPLRAIRAAPLPLPQTLPAWDLGPARRDLFASMPAAPADPPLPEPPPPVIAFEPPAQPQQPPPLPLRYLGTMVTPDGERLVMLAHGDTAVPVQPGIELEEGYVVQALTPESVRLAHPATGTVVELALPAADSR